VFMRCQPNFYTLRGKTTTKVGVTVLWLSVGFVDFTYLSKEVTRRCNRQSAALRILRYASDTFAVYTGVLKGAVHRWLLLWALHVVSMRNAGDSVRNLGEKFLGKRQPRRRGKRGDI